MTKKTKLIALRVTKDEHRSIFELSRIKEITISNYLRELIKRDAEKHDICIMWGDARDRKRRRGFSGSQIRDMRKRRNGGSSLKEIAFIYDITPGMISRIVNFKAYSDIQ